MKRLENKVAFITGGSRGIGAAIAIKMATEGADVIFTYLHSAQKAAALVDEIKKTGCRALAIKADSGHAGELTAAVEQAGNVFGRIDILVNNAGIYNGKPFAEHTLEDFNTVIDVNVKAVFVASQAALKFIPPGGRIISIGSCMANRVMGPSATFYAMSKSALLGFTKGLARDIGDRKITANLIQPGPTNTDMNPQDGPHSDWQRSFMAIPEYGSAEDIAAMVVWVASDEAGFVTGAALTIDGGMTV